ncbi:hypothetical protein Ancab_008634 [Ancistrocladus abbreviatus]
MEASLRWLSPSDEKVVGHDKDDAGYGSDLCQTLLDFKVFNCWSPLSSHVFSSELANSSKSGTTTSDATNNSRRVSFFFLQMQPLDFNNSWVLLIVRQIEHHKFLQFV